MRVRKMQNLVHKKKALSPPKRHDMRYKLEEKSECDYWNKMARGSQGTNIRRTKRNITRTKSCTNKEVLETCP
jgi:hypothetical protein